MKIIFTVLVVTLIIVLTIPVSSQSQITSNIDTLSTTQICSGGWYITGYFLPTEIDYSSKMSPIIIDGKVHSFKSDFVNEVKIQGWGKTISGEYLGSYDGKFYLGNTPLDSLGNNLGVGSIAVDPQIIKRGTKVTIPTLPQPWNGTVFDSNDVGPAIIGKHIDVYTGEGLGARKEAFRITGYDNSVCFINESTMTNQLSEDISVDASNSNSKKIPDWVKNIFIWYGQDQVSEDDVLNTIKFLINQGIIKLN